MKVEKLSILIIDDHPLFRKGIISILETTNIVQKIYEAGNLEEAYKIIDEAKIDLVTLDLNLPNEDGIKFLSKYVERNFKILVITTFNSPFLVNEVLNKGADGYIKKENLYDNLIEAIQCVFDDKLYIEDRNCYENLELNLDQKASRYFFLTPAEKEVFKLLANGKNPKEIANITGKSYKTIENQKNSIMKKMELKTEVELFKVAMRLNLTNL